MMGTADLFLFQTNYKTYQQIKNNTYKKYLTR